MPHRFDDEVDRRGTDSVKWEFMHMEEGIPDLVFTDRSFGENRVLPMWVADMDFRSPEPVIQALVRRAEHGIFGYTAATESFYAAVVNWMARRHGWNITPEWIRTTPGVVPAINMMVRTYTEVGEGILIQPPVYHPFKKAIENNDRRTVTSPLVYEAGHYRMDFEDLDKKVQDDQVRMMILCSPHNPVGRVWTKDELRCLGEICIEHGVVVVADEIHGDLIYPGHTFAPFASLGEKFAEHSITCTAGSKTFNLAGLHTSCIIISNRELRLRFIDTLEKNGLHGLSTFGAVALQTAYEQGDAWLEQVMDYIEANYACLETFIEEQIPQIKVIKPEGTYLVWLDFRALGLSTMELKQLMLEQARVYLDEGYIFGPEGEGFERINIACPRTLLLEALERIKRVVADYLPE